MTSGQQASQRRRQGSSIHDLLLVMVMVVTGCTPFQKTWSPRFRTNGWSSTFNSAPPVQPQTGRSDPDTAQLERNPDPGNHADPPDHVQPNASTVGSVPMPLLDSAPHRVDRSESPIEPPVNPSTHSPISAPVSAPEPVDDLDAIDLLMDQGIDRLTGLENYRVTLERQERVRETLQPAETVVLSVRTEPFAVRLEWPDGPNRGREVLYSGTECNGMMHIKLAKTLIPVPPMLLDPQSPLALSNSRHPITEAGLLHILTRTKEQVAQIRSGDSSLGDFRLEGPHVPEEFETLSLEVLRTTPEGEFWRLVLDQATSLPVLLQATAADGQLLERYHFQDIQTNLEELNSSEAFDPAVRFGRPLALPIDRLTTVLPE